MMNGSHKLKFILLAGLFWAQFVEAWELEQKSELQPNFYYRQIPQLGFSTREHSYDLFLRASTQLRIYKDNYQFEIKPELSGYKGDSTALSGSGDAYYLSVKTPDRHLNLRKKLSDKDEWYLDLEKLNFSFNQEELELSLGRKPVSLGVLKIFSVWNKFSKPLPITAGPPAVLSSDNLSVHYQRGTGSMLGTYIVGPKDADSVILAEFTYYDPLYEFHCLAANWWQHSTFGLAFAKDLWGATWRLESLLIKANNKVKDTNDEKNKHEQDETQSGFGVEYAFDEKASFLSEFLMQSQASRHASEYPNFQGSRFQSFRAYAYNYTQLQYKVTSLLTSVFSVLGNLVDGSKYWIIKSQYSYSDNTDFFAELDIPNGTDHSEFTRKSRIYANGMYIGAPTQISMGLKNVF
jgi:hypothetical protein